MTTQFLEKKIKINQKQNDDLNLIINKFLNVFKESYLPLFYFMRVTEPKVNQYILH